MWPTSEHVPDADRPARAPSGITMAIGDRRAGRSCPTTAPISTRPATSSPIPRLMWRLRRTMAGGVGIGAPMSILHRLRLIIRPLTRPRLIPRLRISLQLTLRRLSRLRSSMRRLPLPRLSILRRSHTANPCPCTALRPTHLPLQFIRPRLILRLRISLQLTLRRLSALRSNMPRPPWPRLIMHRLSTAPRTIQGCMCRLATLYRFHTRRLRPLTRFPARLRRPTRRLAISQPPMLRRFRFTLHLLRRSIRHRPIRLRSPMRRPCPCTAPRPTRRPLQFIRPRLRRSIQPRSLTPLRPRSILHQPLHP